MDRIDVHAHFLPPKYYDACKIVNHDRPDGMPNLPPWDLDSHLELMKNIGITKSILSVSTPGTHLTDPSTGKTENVTSYCNDYAATLKREHPAQFGFWASLPLPDIDASLAEIDRAEGLGADGFALLTNQQGHYLGDPIYDRVFEKLNEKKATVFIHPTTPCVACQYPTSGGASFTQAAPLAAHYPNPMMEFFFDTARVFMNLFMSGTVERSPNIKFIIPHLGGAMPPLLSRFTGFSNIVAVGKVVTLDDVKQAIQKQFYFDLAGFAMPGQIVGLVQGVGVDYSRLLYGSDFPYTPAKGVEKLSKELQDGLPQHFTKEQIEAIYNHNATKLLERNRA